MANTPNIDLVKPAGTDHALVSVLNSNSDKIDTFAGSTNQAITTLQGNALQKAGNYATVDPDTFISGFQHCEVVAAKSPTGANFYGEILAYRGDGQNVFQHLFNGSRYFIRNRGNSGTWGAFQELATIGTVLKRELFTLSDFHSVTVDNNKIDRLYYGTNVSNIANKPSEVSGAYPFTLDVYTMDSYPVLRLIVYGGVPIVFYKQKYWSGGSVMWGSWAKVNYA